MSMTSLGLCNAIKAATNPPIEFTDTQLLAICNAIVTYLQLNATITIPAGVAVQVTPATGTGTTIAPGVGTIS